MNTKLMIRRARVRASAASWAFVALALTCPAQKTTVTTGAGNWNDSIWGNGAPAAGDTVVIAHAVALTNSTPALAAFTNNAAVTFIGWGTVLSADVVVVNATITHNAQSATAIGGGGLWVPDNRIVIACSNLTVNSGKAIDANGKGYQGNTGTGASATLGRGPGRPLAISYRGSGASYGGKGGRTDGSAVGPTYGHADAYGDRDMPQHPGSSGSNGNGGTSPNRGGDGGGVIRIEASGAVAVEGAISANGGNGTYIAGGGSGGSVLIACGTITGSGTLSVTGGNAGEFNSGDGGGGRLAVIVSDTSAQQALSPFLTISAAVDTDQWGSELAERGTLSLVGPSSSFIYSPVAAGNKPPLGTVYGLSNVTVVGDLQVSGVQLLLAEPGVSVTVSGAVGVSAGTLRLGSPEPGPAFALTCGSLAITNGATCVLYASEVSPASGVTNVAAPVYGGAVTVGGALLVGSNCTVYPYSHPTNGGSVLFEAQTVMIAGAVNAHALGFRGGTTTSGDRDGKGPGGGSVSDQPWRWAGGSYGGKGAAGSSGVARNPYCVSNAPVAPGSGGAACSGNGDRGGAGGGLIRIDTAGTLALTGTLTANGENSVRRGSAGSGGGIFLTCRRFEGNGGTLTAKGGVGGSTDKPDGGGGRIAIRGYVLNTNGCAISVIKGTSGGAGAQNGTLSLTTLPVCGTAVLVK